MTSQSAGYQITKRKKSGKELGPWQMRVFVPKALQSRVGKREVWRSLGTTDRRTADRRAVVEVAAIYAEWELAADFPSTDPAEVAVRIGFDSMLAAMKTDRKSWPADDAEYAAKLSKRQANLRRWTRSLQEGDLSRWEGHAARFAVANGLTFESGSDEHAAFIRTFAEANVDAIDVFVRQTEGELEAAPRTAVVRETKRPRQLPRPSPERRR